jgi:ABC-2 type transport system permease protein
MQALRRIAAITRKEFRQLRRDKLTFGMIVGIPFVLLLLFGYAINTNVRNLRAGVLDLAHTEQSRSVLGAIFATQVMQPAVVVQEPAELERLLQSNEIDVGVILPEDLGRRIARNELPAVQLLVDGADTAVAGAVSGVMDLPAPGAEAGSPGLFSMRILYNVEKRSAVSIVPGLLGVILTMTMVLFTSIAIVRERERGSLELLITTPVRSFELMAGKILPYIGIGLIQVSLLLILGLVLFEVPVRGSLLDLFLASLGFIAANLALGLLFSTIAANQFQSFQLTFFFFLPSMLLSGFMFPFAGLPGPAKVLAGILPLTHFIRLARGILLKGAGLHALGQDLWPLGLFFAAVLVLTLSRFRKSLD